MTKQLTTLNQPRFHVIAIDDTGSHKAFTGYRTALLAAKAVASVVDGININEFASTWNASNESGSCRYEIGQE